MDRKNYLQTMRKKNLDLTASLIKQFGNEKLMMSGGMGEFSQYLAFELGCSLKTAKEYVDTVRGAVIFKLRTNYEEVKEE